MNTANKSQDSMEALPLQEVEVAYEEFLRKEDNRRKTQEILAEKVAYHKARPAFYNLNECKFLSTNFRESRKQITRKQSTTPREARIAYAQNHREKSLEIKRRKDIKHLNKW